MVKHIINFRTLPESKNRYGLKLKNKTIFRSGNPAKADSGDIETLLSLKINNIYDFRSEEEIQRNGTIGDPSINVKHIEIIEPEHDVFINMKEDRDRVEELMLQLYREKLPISTGFRRFIKEVLRQKEPVFLFHCTAGKDRTGIAGVILMTLLDFSEEDIYREYLNQEPAALAAMTRKIRTSFRKSGIDLSAEAADVMASVRRSYLDAYFRGIDEKYGGMEEYISGFLEISQKEKDLLKERYLEKC